MPNCRPIAAQQVLPSITHLHPETVYRMQAYFERRIRAKVAVFSKGLIGSIATIAERAYLKSVLPK